MKKTSEEILQLKIKELEEQLELKTKLVFMLDEAIPKGETEQRKYVSDIALFYQTTFKEKLKHFIGLQLEELAQIGRTELSSNIIRSNINVFRLIDEWMNKKTNEHIGNVETIRSRFDNDADFINEMRTLYGEN